MKFKNIIIFFIFITFISCTKKANNVNSIENSDNILIGTFNVEWLGDGTNDRKDRTEEDYKLIAKIISDQNPDLMGIEEVENSNALNRVVKYLDNYDLYVGKGGNQQNVALLYKKGLKVNILGEYYNLAVEYRRTRPGLVFEVKKNNFDFLGMVVHLKSTSRYDYGEEGKYEQSVDIRTRQNQILSNWADSVIKNNQETDLVIMGDFNDTPVRKKNNTMQSLTSNNNLIFLTDDMKSCKYKSANTIDHILVSQTAFKRVIQQTLKMVDLTQYAQGEQLKQLSDHCPVFVSFEIKTPDNDNSTIANK